MRVDSISSAGGVDRTESLEALANDHRRRVLLVLRATDGPMTLTELALELAWEDTAGGDLEKSEIDRHRTSLYHRHVPKLRDAGLVDYDEEERTVALVGERSGTEVPIDE